MPTTEFTDPGPWAGHQQAFAVIASHCSAAQAHCLKKARDSRAFEPLGLNWDQYAKRHFGVSRSQADNLIRRLDQFGESYFHISQLARIGPAAYRRIADRVVNGRFHVDGEQFEIAPENAPKIRAAIETLRAEWRTAQPAQKARPKPAPSAAPAVPGSRPVSAPDPEDSNPSLSDPAASLDDWHHAASVSDEDRFFSHFTADARILGVCPSERWTLSRFHCGRAGGLGRKHTPFRGGTGVLPRTVRDLGMTAHQHRDGRATGRAFSCLPWRPSRKAAAADLAAQGRSAGLPR